MDALPVFPAAELDPIGDVAGAMLGDLPAPEFEASPSESLAE
jgi:hypothetical protein